MILIDKKENLSSIFHINQSRKHQFRDDHELTWRAKEALLSMNTFNVYKINSALSETDPVIMIGQEEGYGNIRRIIPNPKHPVPGFALTPQVITRSDPRLVIRKIGSYADFKSAFNAASRVVNTLKLA